MSEPTNNPSPSLCRHCKKEITEGAKVCSHCNRHQNWFSHFIETRGVIVSAGSVIVSIAVAILAFLQFSEAKNERIKAENALAATSVIAEVLLESAAWNTGLGDDIDALEMGIEVMPLIFHRTKLGAKRLSALSEDLDSMLESNIFIKKLLRDNLSEEDRRAFVRKEFEIFLSENPRSESAQE